MKWTSRKFWTMMLWQAVATAMLWFGKLESEHYWMLSGILVGSYMAANVAAGKRDADS